MAGLGGRTCGLSRKLFGRGVSGGTGLSGLSAAQKAESHFVGQE